MQNDEFRAFVDLNVPGKITKGAVTRGEICSSVLAFSTRPMIGEDIRVHDYFTENEDNLTVLARIVSIEHGMNIITSLPGPGIYITAVIVDEVSKKPEVRALRPLLEMNGWNFHSTF